MLIIVQCTYLVVLDTVDSQIQRGSRDALLIHLALSGVNPVIQIIHLGLQRRHHGNVESKECEIHIVSN